MIVSPKGLDLIQSLSGATSAESMMVQMQMMLVENFDEQMRSAAEKIKLLGKVKKEYRAKINVLEQFMSQMPDTSRRDNQHYYKATPEQMVSVLDALQTIDYDLETASIKGETSLLFEDTGDKHTVHDVKRDPDGHSEDAKSFYVTPNNDQAKASEYRDFFAGIVVLKDPKEQMKMAENVSDDDGSLPFYFGHTKNQTDDGRPLFSFLEKSLDKMMEQLKNSMSDVDQESEGLGVDLNRLTSQRKAAMDVARQLIQKVDEIKKNTVSKL